MNKLSILMILSLLTYGINLSADEEPGKYQEIFKLWPNEVPQQLSKEKQNPERWDKWGLVDIHEPTLTYYPATKNDNGSTILILPGGGYRQVCINHEGYRVGEWFSTNGVSAFVLKYRCKPYEHPVPLLDTQRAMRFIRFNAKKFNINPDKIGVIGFSAGGHLASSLSVHYGMKTYEPKDTIDSISAKPDFAVLVYPVISMDLDLTHKGSRYCLIGKEPTSEMVDLMSTYKQVNKETPPTYLVHGKADTGVLPKNSELYYEALKKNNVPTELLLIDNVSHGFGLKNNWAEKSLNWLNKNLLEK